MSKEKTGFSVGRFIETFKINNHQLAFGSYAAELSFYIIWSLIPITLALSNIIAVLPISQEEILHFIQMILPYEVEVTVIPLIEGYLDSTSSSVFSLGIIISLWPLSNVFNTLQRVFNTIYKSPDRQNFFVARAFAYIFTIFLVFILLIGTLLIVFGEQVLALLESTFQIQFTFLEFIMSQSWLIGLVLIFLLIVMIYHWIPNVDWAIRFSLPGSLFTLLGFVLVSQLFTIYLSFTSQPSSNSAIGVFIILVIWLYFNSMVLAIGAYVNVFVHDYSVADYRQVPMQNRKPDHYQERSPGFIPRQNLDESVLRQRIYKVNPGLKEAKTDE